MDQTLVMDVVPWPNGRGFKGGTTWREYMLRKEEKQRLDNLMGLALLDDEVCDRLVNKRDESLLSGFGLSEETRSWLSAVQASSLVELAQAIVSRPQLQAEPGISGLSR